MQIIKSCAALFIFLLPATLGCGNGHHLNPKTLYETIQPSADSTKHPYLLVRVCADLFMEKSCEWEFVTTVLESEKNISVDRTRRVYVGNLTWIDDKMVWVNITELEGDAAGSQTLSFPEAYLAAGDLLTITWTRTTTVNNKGTVVAVDDSVNNVPLIAQQAQSCLQNDWTTCH